MSLKTRIAAGDALLGTFVKTSHPQIFEVLAQTSLDLLVVDAEHAPFDRGDIDLAVMASRAGGIPVIVRPAEGSPSAILNSLDCGADGVLVPHVRSAAEARAVARAAHYGPDGRGYAGTTRAAGYGRSGMAEHRRVSGETTVVIAQIEDLKALDELEAIAAVEGIDALFVGRADLTVALGCASPDDPPVVAAVDRICAVAKAAGRPVGMFLPRAADTATWRAKGASLFFLSSDHGFLRQGAEALRRETGLTANR